MRIDGSSAGSTHAIPRWDGSGHDFFEVASLLVHSGATPDDGVEPDDGPQPDVAVAASDVLPQVTDISVDVAGGCNLACRYCFENDIRSRTNFPSAETLTDVRLFLREGKGLAKDIALHFGSGEPLLNFKALRRLVDEVMADFRATGRTVTFHITTNATLVTREVADFLQDRPFVVRVSCDGPAEIHDLNRPYRTKVPSHGHVMRGLELLLERLAERLIVNSVVTAGTRVHDVWSWAASLGIRHHNVIKVGADTAGGLLASMSEADQYRSDFQAIAMAILDQLDRGKRPMDFQPLTKPILRLARSRRQERYCGAGGTYLGLSATGHIYPCFRFLGLEPHSLGNLRDGVDLAARKAFMVKFAPPAAVRKGCAECWARHLCGGGCYADSVIFADDPARPLAAHCPFTRIELEAAVSLYARLMERPPNRFLQLFGMESTELLARIDIWHDDQVSNRSNHTFPAVPI